MKKLLTSFIALSLILAPTLRADGTQADVMSQENQTEQMSNSDLPSDEGTPVSQAQEDDGRRAARRKRWQNAILAVSAVAVAITAMILVANNDGHKKK